MWGGFCRFATRCICYLFNVRPNGLNPVTPKQIFLDIEEQTHLEEVFQFYTIYQKSESASTTYSHPVVNFNVKFNCKVREAVFRTSRPGHDTAICRASTYNCCVV